MKLIGTSCSVRSHWSPCFQPVRTDWLLGWWNERISQEAEFLTLPPALPVSWLQTNRNPLISVQEWSICVQLEQRVVHGVTETGSVRNASLPAARPFIQRSNLTSERWCSEQRSVEGISLLKSRTGIAIYLQIIWRFFKGLMLSSDMICLDGVKKIRTNLAYFTEFRT